MNEARSLENGWKSHVSSPNYGLGSNTHSNINSRWGTNNASNEGSAHTQLAPYILPPLQLSGTRKIPNDFRDDLMCPITQEIFTDPVVVRYGNTYEQSSLIKWLKNVYKSPITNLPLDSNILSSKINIRKLLLNLSARTTDNNGDATSPSRVI